MANTILEFEAPSGLTLTADVVTLADTVVLNDAAASERTNSKGLYRATDAGANTGIHLIVYSSGSTVIGRQWVNITADDTSTYRAVDSYRECLAIPDAASDGAGGLPISDAGGLDMDALATAWTTALTEAYRSTGATGTPAQLMYEIIAHLGEFAILGTTKTLKKLDGSTTAKTHTLDDATDPTSITEAT